MNLVQELGVPYLREHIVGCYFRYGDKIAHLMNVDSSGLVVNTVELAKAETAQRYNKEILPYDTLKSFKDLGWPRLGYRNFKCDDVYGNAVAYLTTSRSVHRGFREELVGYSYMDVYSAMYWQPHSFTPTASRIYRLAQIFEPQWIGFKEGMERIRKLEIPAFAMNEDIAIAASIRQGPDRYCDIYFRDRVVGHITEGGDFEIGNVIMKKSSLRRLRALMET